jgi:hypothetical protein
MCDVNQSICYQDVCEKDCHRLYPVLLLVVVAQRQIFWCLGVSFPWHAGVVDQKLQHPSLVSQALMPIDVFDAALLVNLSRSLLIGVYFEMPSLSM